MYIYNFVNFKMLLIVRLVVFDYDSFMIRCNIILNVCIDCLIYLNIKYIKI